VAGLTYAQKLCCGAPKDRTGRLGCFKKNSARKLLILLGLQKSPFSGEARQALDLPGLAGGQKISIPKVIHKERASRQTVVESRTYPGFRDVCLSRTPKSAAG
jgi:hypothetical protein